jgi:hypothetical protein
LRKKSSKFCNRACYSDGYRKGIITNKGFFKKGAVSINKGQDSRVLGGRGEGRQHQSKDV